MQKIAILYDASQIVISTFDLDEVLTRILATVRDYFRMGNGAIFTLDRSTQELYVRSQFGREAQDRNFRVPVGKGIVGSAAKLKRPVYAPDVRKDSRYVEVFSNIGSELAIPLMVRDELAGVLDLQSDEINGFDKEMIDLLTLFSTQASIAIQNAELYGREQRRAAQMAAINSISLQMRSELELNELLPKACKLIHQHFPVDHVSVLLLESDMLTMRAHYGKLSERLKEGLSFHALGGLSGAALTQRKMIIANDVSQFPEYVPVFEKCTAELCIPLISFGRELGVLVLDNAGHTFLPDDVQALESVGDICAAAIQNAHSYEGAKIMADLDGLTGVFNRRHLEKRIVSEIERLARYKHRLAVLMIDLDHFKRINDEFGHLLGDEVLKHASFLMKQHVRKVDIVCRYGGEEFAILLPETSAESAANVAEKLRRAVSEFNFPGIPRPVTVSIGIAESPQHGASRDELIRAADEALYVAKQEGRNRVVRFDHARARSSSASN